MFCRTAYVVGDQDKPRVLQNIEAFLNREHSYCTLEGGEGLKMRRAEVTN